MTIPTALAAPHSSQLGECKRAMRASALRRRADCDPALGLHLARKLLVAGLIPPGAVVAGFWPLPGEIDIRPLLHALHESGRTVVLPRTPARGQALSFHRWTPGEALLPGPFGTAHPDGPSLAPTVVLAPLLAFDRTGGRLGYGGGYYDRTLAALPGVAAIGCAFAGQEVDRIPAGPHDIRLHAIATERGVIHIDAERGAIHPG